MKLLVTGGAGFIGSNFIHYWLKSHPDDEIVNFDSLTYAANLENLSDIESNPNYKFAKGDICDKSVVSGVMKGIDAVVHFAAESHVDNSITGPDVFIQTNVVGTHMLLKAALDNKVKRFHHVSTDEVYGELELDSTEKFNESTLYDPSSPYSASKAGSDHLVMAYFKTFGLPTTITNCSNNYGPYQHKEKFLPTVILSLLANKKIPVYGDGLYVRDWLYVEDHCRAIDLVLSNGRIGETYSVGGMTEDVSNLEMVKKIIEILGKDESSIEFVKDRAGHDRRYAVNWSKIRSELGFEPKFNLEENLAKTVEWYRNNQG
jgi:dTDP-glucose 4,6-dehydratase